jgi:hypothetical protein
MAVRAPLKLDGSNNLIEMDATDIANIQAQCRYLYGLNPTVNLSVVASGGNLGTINDTRLQAGAFSSSVSSFPSEAVTAEPSVVTVGYSRINTASTSTFENPDLSNLNNPLYQSGGDLYAMSNTDMFDTFIFPAITSLADGTDRPGTFRIHTATSLAGHTLMSATPVFSDTRADTSLYTAAGIPEALDQPTTITNFYLFRTDAGSPVSYTTPVRYQPIGDIYQFSTASFDAALQQQIRYAASGVVGYRLTYTINGAGNNRGSAMTDTRLNGAGNYQQLFVNSNDYRAQEFPNGTAVTVSTYSLRVGLT